METRTKKQQSAFFIPIFTHSHQFWTYGRWLISIAMKSQKEQRGAMKSSKKLRRTTKSNSGYRSWKNQNGQERNQDEQRKAQKIQMETRLKFLFQIHKFLTLQWTLIKLYGRLKLVLFSKKSGHPSLADHEILTFGGHSSANFQPILDCFTPAFKLKYEDSENIKSGHGNTVVFNLHQIKWRALFFFGGGHPIFIFVK